MTPSDELPQIGDKIRSRQGMIGVVCSPPPHAASFLLKNEVVWAHWNDDSGRPLYASLKSITIIERAKPDYNDGEWI